MHHPQAAALLSCTIKGFDMPGQGRSCGACMLYMHDPAGMVALPSSQARRLPAEASGVQAMLDAGLQAAPGQSMGPPMSQMQVSELRVQGPGLGDQGSGLELLRPQCLPCCASI